MSESDGEINLATGRPLISDLFDEDEFPTTPADMDFQLDFEHERMPFEMTYSHVSTEEVHKYYWTGVVRDWHKVQAAMDRDTLQRQMNN